jgi:hypothetical protein
VRHHEAITKLLTLRRIPDAPRAVRSGFRRVRRYEVYYPTGEHRVVTLRQLHATLQGRTSPADFWVCVGAADEAFAAGETDRLIEWPTGRSSDRD